MGHTHDGIDWTDRLASLRRADEMDADVTREIAERLVDLVARTGGAPRPVAVDVGSGGGGMSAALALALGKRGGGTVVLADAVPELLAGAAEGVTETVAAAGLGDSVTVEARLGDAADAAFIRGLPAADLLWAARVVHHLPDQQRAVDELAGVLAPNGWLALGEGGLASKCLPWDLGIGEPGLGDRLIAARDGWFVGMRAEMPGVARLPYGWNRALAAAGLTDVSSSSYLSDHPAPASPAVRESVVTWLTWMGGREEVELTATDRETVRRLLDPTDPAYVKNRDDVFHLSASTVHLGRRSSA